MYAYLLVATVMWHGKPVKFYHTSKQRFGYERTCLDKGAMDGDRLLARLLAYSAKPNVKTHVSCRIQETRPT